ncbi:hypothetical protein [Hymenobacter sp. AT01-02]|uniref:hypothetical protein n=1 Tax=Hymenobacter sp. AT01-02 TaxID=1571877 RepID=UPI0005F2459C|nr:hypothetical protein [Hymenobacter sp. AT01-02]
MSTDTFSTGPAAVFARIEHNGQHLTVVKLQQTEGPLNTSALQQHLTTALGLAPNALLLVLPTEGGPVLGQGPAEQLYNDYLSTNTAAVVEQTWQPLG